MFKTKSSLIGKAMFMLTVALCLFSFSSKAEEVVIGEDGILRYQPKGFFDQAENDLYSLYNE